MFKQNKRRSLSERALYWVVSFVFMVVALSYVYILVWMIISGLKTHTEVVSNPFSLPEIWNWSHFIEVFHELEVNGVNFVGMIFNSVWFSVMTALISQFTAMTFAYACTKYTFPGSKLVYPIIIVMITLPIYGSGGATYRLYHNLGLIDSYAQVITAAAGFSMNFLYYSAFLKNLSWTYAESAQIDGANDFEIYFRVMLPQMRPIFGALFLTSWVGSWNSYESALVYLPNLPTLPVGIYQFNTEMIYRARLDILFAACFIVSIPALILYISFNKMITTNVSVGGIKG